MINSIYGLEIHRICLNRAHSIGKPSCINKVLFFSDLGNNKKPLGVIESFSANSIFFFPANGKQKKRP